MGVDNTGPQPEITLQGPFIYSCLIVGFNFLLFFSLYRFSTTNMTFLVERETSFHIKNFESLTSGEKSWPSGFTQLAGVSA